MNSHYGMVFYPAFYPENSTAHFNCTDDLIAQLQSNGFIGNFFEFKGQKGYLIGDDFLKLVTFLGCSPHIEVTPPEQLSEWGNFCYIDIKKFLKPRFFKGLDKPKCSCPHCKYRVVNVLPNMELWTPDTQKLICPKCRKITLTEHLNWRHGAGFGQYFIVVNSVYPNEAVPGDYLMSLLKSASNKDWDYFYFE